MGQRCACVRVHEEWRKQNFSEYLGMIVLSLKCEKQLNQVTGNLRLIQEDGINFKYFFFKGYFSLISRPVMING